MDIKVFVFLQAPKNAFHVSMCPCVHVSMSTAVVRANQTLLLSRLGQCGEGAGLAGRRRQWLRSEEIKMKFQREADWRAGLTGKEVIRRGRYWGR